MSTDALMESIFDGEDKPLPEEILPRFLNLYRALFRVAKVISTLQVTGFVA
jgi:hypothetical protein